MSKKIKLIVALLAAMSLVVTGTFAFQQIAEYRNEFIGQREGTTLHDDFDPGTGDKDVYVENTGSTPLLVRMKLDETMKLGSYTWRPESRAEWAAHTFGSSAADCGHSSHEGERFHDYFEWSMGGSKYFMSTDGSRPVVHDTKPYTAEDAAMDPNIKLTPHASIITIDEYLGYDDEHKMGFIGWVYDADGYVYWSRMLPAGEATGLLLNHVKTDEIMKNYDYYYAINVILEAVDAKDAPMWLEGAESVDKSGATHEQATDKGARLILFILANDPNGGEAIAPVSEDILEPIEEELIDEELVEELPVELPGEELTEGTEPPAEDGLEPADEDGDGLPAEGGSEQPAEDATDTAEEINSEEPAEGDSELTTEDGAEEAAEGETEQPTNDEPETVADESGE